MKNSIVIGTIVTVLAGISLVWLTSSKPSSSPEVSTSEPSIGKAVVYKTSNCGCCAVYTKYLPKEGVQTEYIDITNQQLKEMQKKYNISDQLASCHITLIGGYFVSGHIPIETIKKLVSEKPNIAGIVLAGMPSGTPGMPGPKNASWIIYAIDSNGLTSEFMTI